MKKVKDTLMSGIFLLVFSLVLARCGGPDKGSATIDSSSLNRPAPDNNSATNSSLADTAYNKDSTGKKLDTTKPK